MEFVYVRFQVPVCPVFTGGLSDMDVLVAEVAVKMSLHHRLKVAALLPSDDTQACSDSTCSAGEVRFAGTKIMAMFLMMPCRKQNKLVTINAPIRRAMLGVPHPRDSASCALAPCADADINYNRELCPRS